MGRYTERLEAERRKQEGRGREADWPSQIPAVGWKDIAWRLWGSLNEDRVLLVAAGVTFYLLLALFPALAALVSVYGLVADPQTIANQISSIGGVVPPTVLDIVRAQLESLARQDRNSLSFGFLIGLAVALWGANSGIKALFDAMNIAYEEREKRSFILLNFVSLTFTLCAIATAIFLLLVVGWYRPRSPFLNLDRSRMRFCATAAGYFCLWSSRSEFLCFTVLARAGNTQDGAGSVGVLSLAAIVWVAASWAFSWYLQNFADFNATYGSLGCGDRPAHLDLDFHDRHHHGCRDQCGDGTPDRRRIRPPECRSRWAHAARRSPTRWAALPGNK